jgi:hypothetical protein
MRGAHVRGGMILAGLLSLTACGGAGATAVVEAGSDAKSAAPAGSGAGCSTAAYDPTSGTPAPTPLEVFCNGGAEPITPVGPDTSVSSPVLGSAGPGTPVDEVPSYQVVKPRPGMADVHPVTWEKADARTPTSLRVRFWGGVEPCYVLDSVRVAYKAKTVVVTLFSGSDPARPDVACIDIAKAMAVDVKLSEPLGGRKVVDGSPNASAPGTGTTDPGVTAPPAAKMPAPTEEGARVVTPRPGMADPQPQSWTSARSTGARTVRVFFMSGVEPCSVLDRYKVTYEAERVVITLYSGHDPKAGDVSCIMIAESKAVDVRLDEALGGREIVDGAAA